MPSPLIILVSAAIIAGAFGSLFVLVAIAVDTWETIKYDSSKLTQYVSNSSTTVQVTLPSTENSFIHLREYKDSTWTSYFLYDQYGGAWRLCDSLTGTQFDSIDFLISMHVKKRVYYLEWRKRHFTT